MKRITKINVVLFSAALLCVATRLSPAVSAQTVVSSSVVPASGGSYYCAKCGKYHAAANAGSTITIQPSAYTSSVIGQAPTINPAPRINAAPSGNPVLGGVQNVLSTLNAQRARNGVGSLQYDPALQAVAARRAQLMASMSLKSHPPGSFAPGTYEGVGWSSSYSPSGVSACFTNDSRMRAAGAAMATGSDGVYFAVVYR